MLGKFLNMSLLQAMSQQTHIQRPCLSRMLPLKRAMWSKHADEYYSAKSATLTKIFGTANSLKSMLARPKEDVYLCYTL